MAATTAVQLITGFLGSGKTTFLNRVIRSFPKDRKLMILMNEFGEVGVDGALVEGEDLDILEISKGSIFCVCVKTDFIKGLNEIAQKHKPDVLLMESTGVANPADLKRDLSLPFFQGRFELAEQFCLLDVANFEEAYDVFASVEKQIASSTVFLLNKIDLATPEQVRRVKELVARHHPNPRFFETTYAALPIEEFLPAARTPSPETASPAQTRLLSAEELEQAIDALLDDPDRELTPPDRLLSAVYAWEGAGPEAFRALAAKLPQGIIRGKGFLSEGQDTRLFSLVMGRWTLEAATLSPNRADLLNRVVFIAPPEVMPLLGRLGEEFPGFRLRALLDPAARGMEREASHWEACYPSGEAR